MSDPAQPLSPAEIKAIQDYVTVIFNDPGALATLQSQLEAGDRTVIPGVTLGDYWAGYLAGQIGERQEVVTASAYRVTESVIKVT